MPIATVIAPALLAAALWAAPASTAPARTMEEHAAWLDAQVRAKGRGDLYFVGHSLGSIVIRFYLGRYRPAAAKRFVMIAPPNHGSVMADKMGKTGVYRLVWGDRSGRPLRASSAGFWTDLPPLPVEFGIIAGGRGAARGFNPLIPGDNYGTVAVSEARLDGARISSCSLTRTPPSWPIKRRRIGRCVSSIPGDSA